MLDKVSIFYIDDKAITTVMVYHSWVQKSLLFTNDLAPDFVFLE